MLTMFDYRQDRRLSQHELGIAANTSTATIKRLERDPINWRIARLINHADQTLNDGPHTWIRPRLFYPVSMEPMPLAQRDELSPDMSYVQLGYIDPWTASRIAGPKDYPFWLEHRHLRFFTLFKVKRQRPRQVEIITMKPAYFKPVENYLVNLKGEQEHDLQV